MEAGLAKHVGVSNFSIKKLSALMQGARMPPAVNQVEAHPYWRNDELREWCASHGIHLTAYSPLGSPDSATVIGRDKNIKGPLQVWAGCCSHGEMNEDVQ